MLEKAIIWQGVPFTASYYLHFPVKKGNFQTLKKKKKKKKKKK